MLLVSVIWCSMHGSQCHRYRSVVNIAFHMADFRRNSASESNPEGLD